MKRWLLVLLAILLTPAIAVLAAVTYSADITVSDNTSTSYDMLGVTASTNITLLVDNGFLTSSGLDSRVQQSGSDLPWMVASDRIIFAVPSAASTSNVYQFVTGQSAASQMQIVTGAGGSFTTPDHASLEPSSANYSLTIDGYIDTTAGSGKSLAQKGGAYDVFVSPDVSGNITAIIYPNTGSTSNQTLTPDGAGDLTNLPVLVGAATQWQAVLTDDGDTSYIYNNTATWQTTLFSTSNSSIPSSTYIQNIVVYTVLKNNGSDATANITIKSGGIVYYQSAITETAAYATYSATYTTDPATGASWNATAVNNLQIGISAVTAGGSAFITQMYAVVNYYATVSVSATGVSSGNMSVKTILTAQGSNLLQSASSQPDANPESTSVDGLVYRSSGGESWAAITSGAGTTADDSGATSYIGFVTTGSNTWGFVFRGVLVFDTSSLPDTAVIVSANITLRGTEKNDNFGSPKAPNINIYTANTTSNTSLVAGDYNAIGATAFSSPISYADWSVVGNNTFALNTNGLSNISLAGVSKFGVRNANYDVAGADPGAVGEISKNAVLRWATADNVSSPPILTIAYYLPELSLSINDVVVAVVTASGGLSVPDTSTSHVFAQNNVMPYITSIDYRVGGNQKAYYAPIAIIANSILPDRSGNANDATITWGSNPSGVAAAFGYLQSTQTITANTTSQNYIGNFMPTNVNPAAPVTFSQAQAAVENDILYPFVEPFANISNTPGVFFYWFATIIVAVAGFVLSYRTKHLLISAIAFDIPFGYGIAKGFVPEWFIIVLVIWTIGAAVQEARM